MIADMHHFVSSAEQYTETGVGCPTMPLPILREDSETVQRKAIRGISAAEIAKQRRNEAKVRALQEGGGDADAETKAAEEEKRSKVRVYLLRMNIQCRILPW